MRVLCVDDLQLKEFQDLPDDDYAVLSHVWGDAEISQLDMKGWFQSEHFSIAGGDGASAKLCGCREQARKDGIKYFWNDTCIDKPNYTEGTTGWQELFVTLCKSRLSSE